MRLIYEDFSSGFYYGIRTETTTYYVLDANEELFLVIEEWGINGDKEYEGVCYLLKNAEEIFKIIKTMPRSILVDVEFSISIRDVTPILEFADIHEEFKEEVEKLAKLIEEIFDQVEEVNEFYIVKSSPVLDYLPEGNDAIVIEAENLFIYRVSLAELPSNVKEDIQKILGTEVNTGREVIKLLNLIPSPP